MREFHLHPVMARELSAPVLLVCGNRLEALRLVPLLRALRAPGRGAGALLLDTGEQGAEVRDCLREHGLAADLRLPPTRGRLAAGWALARLCWRLRPAAIIAGGASASGLAAAFAARLAGVSSSLLLSGLDAAPLWRRRLLVSFHTWFYLGREAPLWPWPRGRALETGDPLFDLCREQAEASAAAAEMRPGRALLAWRGSPANAEAHVQAWLQAEAGARIDWIAAPLGGEEQALGLRRLGRLPHWRSLALLRRAQVLLTDDAILAHEARWLGRPVLWLGATPAPAGTIESAPGSVAQNLRLAFHGALAARPLGEDGRSANRLAAQILDRIEQRAFAGLLTRSRKALTK